MHLDRHALTPMAERALGALNKYLTLVGTLVAITLAYAKLSAKLDALESQVRQLTAYVCQDKPRDFGCHALRSPGKD